MRAKISWLLSASLLFSASAATAQSFPCASVAPEVRDQVREAGACRDETSGDAPTAAASATVPRAINSTRRDARKRATPVQPAVQARESTPPKPDASEGPAPASSATPQVPDESLVGVAGATPDTTAPVLAPAAAASTTPPPVPAPAVAPAISAVAPTVPTASRRFPMAFSANAALLLGVGVLLGLLFGAMLMRQWLLRRARAAEERAAWMPPPQDPQPFETRAAGVSASDAVPEIGLAAIRFAARLEPGETTIVLASLRDSEDVAIERSSVHHA